MATGSSPMRLRGDGVARRPGVLTAALLLATTVTSLASQPTEPPSFVVLITDDQRHDALGFLHPVLTTPAMDRLAAEGVWFQNAFAATPVCWSSRASMLEEGPSTSPPGRAETCRLGRRRLPRRVRILAGATEERE